MPATLHDFDFSTLLGDELLSKNGPRPTAGALKDVDVVALYFSAHWCPPCRGFTPQLGAFYERHKAAKHFELVFVSSDKSEDEFATYYGEQAPWLALPYANRAAKNALSKKYKVSGIPSLVLLDAKTGALITSDGRSDVANDPEAAKFPWKPPTLRETLAGLPPLATKKGAKTVELADVAGPLLVYFSAHWCPPCRGFTPQLVAFFSELKAAHPDASIVFVSSDKGEAEFDAYFAEMGDDWYALPFSARDDKAALSKHFDVSGIPSLVLLSAPGADGNRDVVTTSARGLVAEAVVNGFPESWKPKPYADLSKGVECNGSDVNETRSLVVLADGMDDSAGAVAALKEAAAKAEAGRSGDVDALYFFAPKTEGPVAQVRKLCGLPAAAPKEPRLLLLDIPDGGAYYVADAAAVTADAIAAFLAAPGPRRQLA
jgi:nucleoredoxin